MSRWLLAFAFTQAVEVPVYVRALGPGRRLAGRALIAFGASAITHPIVWFALPRLWERLYLALVGLSAGFVIRAPLARYACMALLAETFAVVVEWAYLRGFGVRRAWLWSLGANGASVTLGLASRALLGVP